MEENGPNLNTNNWEEITNFLILEIKVVRPLLFPLSSKRNHKLGMALIVTNMRVISKKIRLAKIVAIPNVSSNLIILMPLAVL